jgi:CO dehydrogenase/acetyl-CoA synthase alpha subunit
VIRLETQYWTLVDIPKQEKQETVPSFVLRACSIMEKSQKSGESAKTSARMAEEEEKKRERRDRLEGVNQVASLCTQLCGVQSRCPYRKTFLQKTIEGTFKETFLCKKMSHGKIHKLM